ncbi:hypothetical protein WJX81_007791 [Elliptochloris bilobata]|uniref:DUF1995 domain-containing protein n=1 Tax=Elliptochloris bilobata TaxID=381761 RepID=A0AAW1QJ29_9CHLO
MQQGKRAALEADIPNSREEAIAQAVEALAAQLATAPSSKKAKGFGGAGAKRLAVEMPLADTGPRATAQLAADLLARLPAELAGSFTLVFADVDAALGASDLVPNAVLPLDACEGDAAAGALLIIGAQAEQAGALEALLGRWRGRSAVLLNPGWGGTGGLPGQHAVLAASFDVVYCFEPIAVRAFLTTTEGVVLRRVARGGAAGAPWLVFKRAGWDGTHKLIGRLPRRPNAQDLELVFYNNSAAESPITQGIKAFRGLTSKDK